MYISWDISSGILVKTSVKVESLQAIELTMRVYQHVNISHIYIVDIVIYKFHVYIYIYTIYIYIRIYKVNHRTKWAMAALVSSRFCSFSRGWRGTPTLVARMVFILLHWRISVRSSELQQGMENIAPKKTVMTWGWYPLVI